MHTSGVESLVLNWNKLAMENLREEKYTEAHRLLEKAEELLKYPDNTDSSKLLAITYNNFGCFYKKTEKYSISLKYLFKALDVEISSIFDRTNVAGTHLNICAVFSALNLHSKALTHGILATKLLKEATGIEHNISTMTSLIIALHNTGLEYEFLRDNDNALATYKCGMDLAIKNLGGEHPITNELLKSYYNLISKTSEKSHSNIINERIIKKKSEALPNLKSLERRNKSVNASNKTSTQIISKKESRTSSNKTFLENQTIKKQLPSLERTKIVNKRSKKIIKDLKIKNLEEKINELQVQISHYQKKYEELEENTFKPKSNKIKLFKYIEEDINEEY